MEITKLDTSHEATKELLRRGYVRLRGNEVEFDRASAGFTPLQKALDQASDYAASQNRPSVSAMWNGKAMDVPLGDVDQFAKNPNGYFNRNVAGQMGERGSLSSKFAKPEVPPELRQFMADTGENFIWNRDKGKWVLEGDPTVEWEPPAIQSVAQAEAARDSAEAELAKADQGLADKNFGARLRTYATGVRDVEIAETNQLRDQLRKLVPDRLDQEALSLMRDFKNRPGEMERFRDGTHEFYSELKGEDQEGAAERVQNLQGIIDKALHPTPEMQQADQALTNYFTAHLREGKRLGFLDSSISNEEYITHLLQPKEQKPFSGIRSGRKLGPRNFRFAKERAFPTLLHAVAAGRRPRTLNAFDAVTIYGEKWAKTYAARQFLNMLKDRAIGKWGFASAQRQGKVPANWVELALETRMFRNEVPFTTQEGQPEVAHQIFFVPPEVEKAMRPVFDPNYMDRVPGFMSARLYQSYIKAVELSMSLFHLKALNLGGLGNEGIVGLAKTYASDMDTPAFREQEKALIRAGGTTPILDRTMEAYRGLQSSAMPSHLDVLRSWPVVKQADAIARAVSELTFGIVQRKLKVTDFALKDAAWIERHPDATPAQHFEAQRLIAKEINNVYGGLQWENLGMHRIVLELSKMILLAPDWTYSNFLNLGQAFEGGPGGNAARLFWIRALVWALALTAGASLLMTGKMPKDPTQVYLGKDREGRDIQQNTFFTGALGDAANTVRDVKEFGAVVGLARFLASKIGPFGKAAIHLATNEDVLHRPIAVKGPERLVHHRGGTTEKVGGTLRNTLSGVKQVATDVAPVPFSAPIVARMLTDKQHHYTPEQYAFAVINGRPPLPVEEKKKAAGRASSHYVY